MFHGKHVTLRVPELSDIPDIVQHFNDLEVRRDLNSVTPVSAEEQKEWILRKSKHRREGREYTFVIELQKSHQFLGICSLNQVDPINRSSSLGIAISNKAYWNKGFGTEAMELLIRFGFETLNLHRIYLTVFEYNPRGTRLYEKLGFKETGRRRESVQRFGGFFDMITMDLLAEDYRCSQSKKQ